MITVRVFVTGLGVISPAGSGAESIQEAISHSRSFLTNLHLFQPGPDGAMPAGQVEHLQRGDLPRTHLLAISAAKQAVAKATPPESIFMACTTGGMALTEELMASGQSDPEMFSMHATGTVGQAVAKSIGCEGPVFTVSTACSSSAVALALAVYAMRSGQYKRVLVGGADSLCQLTYFGFHMLQLVDPKGARPLDKYRAGMTVAEGAAMLLLEAADKAPPGSLGEIMGVGLSCDAYHPTAPHPDGTGAYRAMAQALDDAGLGTGDIDYINLHGTGTPDNDKSEAKAVLDLFGDKTPVVSSTKGIFGHSLAASGAIEAVVALDSIGTLTIPPNVGCTEPDPQLGLAPVLQPTRAEIKRVLSNSFGFGGNNASILLGACVEKSAYDKSAPENHTQQQDDWLVVNACECVTGAGFIEQTTKAVRVGKSCSGVFPVEQLVEGLPVRSLRRIKRLSKMAIALGARLSDESDKAEIHQVHFGTGWGPMSETHDFLTRLFADPNKLSSPTDFVGSVHNAPAGQLAIRHKATGPSATATDRHLAFEQALYMAQLLARSDQTTLLVSADEYHQKFSPLLDPKYDRSPSDGGAGFILTSDRARLPSARLRATHLGKSNSVQQIALRINQFISESRDREYGLIMLRIQDALNEKKQDMLALLNGLYPSTTIMEYENSLGFFATVSACAAALAVKWVEDGKARPGPDSEEILLEDRGVLLLNLGEYSAAVEVIP